MKKILELNQQGCNQSVLAGLNLKINRLFEQSSVLILVICLVWYLDMVLSDEILEKGYTRYTKEKEKLKVLGI